MDNGKIIIFMEMDILFKQIMINMMVNGIKIENMDLVHINGMMVIFILEIGLMIKDKVTVNFIGKMVIIMKVNGSMTKDMEKEKR